MKRPAHLLAAVAAFAMTASAAAAEPRSDFKVCWSTYVGWMPWGTIAEFGIMKKWGDRYGITVELVEVDGYVELLDQYAAGAFDACTMTNVDAVSVAAAGTDTTVLIVGDLSNGNDAIILKGDSILDAIAGQEVHLAERSVSAYLLARGLASVGLTDSEITIVDTPSADIAAAYATSSVTAVVARNPFAAAILEEDDAHKVYSSADIPGEIIDLLAVNTQTLNDNPDLGRALAGAWYEMMGIMSKDDDAGRAVRTKMAAAAGTDLAGFDAQLATTEMFYDPADAVAFTETDRLLMAMQRVTAGLAGPGMPGGAAPGSASVGIALPDDRTVGDAGNVKLRFDPSYMRMIADGQL